MLTGPRQKTKNEAKHFISSITNFKNCAFWNCEGLCSVRLSESQTVLEKQTIPIALWGSFCPFCLQSFCGWMRSYTVNYFKLRKAKVSWDCAISAGQITTADEVAREGAALWSARAHLGVLIRNVIICSIEPPGVTLLGYPCRRAATSSQ